MLPAGLDPFEALTAPRREALGQLVAVSRELRGSLSWLPMEGSPAMAELVSEPALSGASPWGKYPVTDAHNGAVMFLAAAEDHLLALCRLLAHPEPTVFAHVAVARAALEAASRAYLLAESGIGAKRRVARYMTERVFSTAQLLRLPGVPAQAEADITKRKNGILAEAERLGFKKVPKKNHPPALEEERASSTGAIKRLVAEDDPDLGGLVYGVYSAVTHATLFGLTNSLAVEAAIEDPMSGDLVKAPMAASADHVNTVLAAVAIGYVNALMAVYPLHGWSSDEWEAAAMTLVRAARSQSAG